MSNGLNKMLKLSQWFSHSSKSLKNKFLFKMQIKKVKKMLINNPNLKSSSKLYKKNIKALQKILNQIQ